MARNIRGYVKRLQEPEGHGDYWKGYNSALNDILSFIDSLQEKPVSKVWHDAWKEEPEKGRDILVKDANTNCCFVSSFEGRKSWEDTYQGYAFRMWAYIDDLLKI